MNETVGLIILTLVCGGIVYVLAHIVVISGVQTYQQSFENQVSVGLKDAFVFLDTKTLFFFNAVALVVAAVLGYLFLGPTGLVIAIVVVGALPTVLVRLMRKRRAARFVYQLPDGLNSMSSGLRAGGSLVRTMEQIAVQQPPPLSQEFAVILSEYRMGRKLEESLADVYKRVKTPEVDLLNSAVSISRSVGGNLAETLDTLAATLREKAQVEGKIKALTAMGRLQAWVACLLPLCMGLLMYKQDPVHMAPLIYEPAGWFALGLIGVLMIPALLMIRKIVNIDI